MLAVLPQIGVVEYWSIERGEEDDGLFNPTSTWCKNRFSRDLVITPSLQYAITP